jgi:transcriptional regulator with XRE-family HTH domain
MTTDVSAFGALLREWRDRHGMSQLELSTASGVSSRHISFIETGRSQPSREMVLRLAETLTVPLRDRNSLLLAAGHAPAYRESPLGDVDLAPVRRALELVLRSHEPYPAFVLDRGWNILLANDAHHRMLQVLKPESVGAEEPVNVMRLVLDPEGLRPRIANWPVVAHVLGHRLRRQLRLPGLAPRERRDLEDLLSLPGVAGAMADETPPPESAVVIPLQLVVQGQTFSWFSTLATIGTPLDVTLDELMIESLFPADDVTAYLAQQLAADGLGGGT